MNEFERLATTEQQLLNKASWANAANEEYAFVDNAITPGQIVAGVKQNSNCRPGSGWQYTFVMRPNTGWHHFAFTYDGVSAKIYLDGSLTTTNSSITGPIDICIGGELIIGAGWSAVGIAGTPDWWNGLIDDIIIYNRALSESEIQQLYQ